MAKNSVFAEFSKWVIQRNESDIDSDELIEIAEACGGISLDHVSRDQPELAIRLRDAFPGCRRGDRVRNRHLARGGRQLTRLYKVIFRICVSCFADFRRGERVATGVPLLARLTASHLRSPPAPLSPGERSWG